MSKQKNTIFSNHVPLEWLFSLKTQDRLRHLWRMELIELNFKVKYKKRKGVLLEKCLVLHAIENDNQSIIASEEDNDLMQEMLDLADEHTTQK